MSKSKRAAALQVHVVWLPMFPGDDRRAALEATRLIDDPRVTHSWDPTRAAGRWFHDKLIRTIPRLSKKPTFRRGIAWDTYLLFGKAARWEKDKLPGPLLASGAPVVRDRTELLRFFGLAARAPGRRVALRASGLVRDARGRW